MTSCLSLGTAQFGEGYGVTNSSGRLSDTDVADILRTALYSGVSLIDTAEGYQDALTRLGRELPATANVEITSKFWLDDDWLKFPVESTRRQLGLLGCEFLEGLLVHNASDIGKVDSSELSDALDLLVAERMIRRYGVSVYDERELNEALTALAGLEMIQFPASIVDNRLLACATVSELHDRGVQMQTRSVFLQGLLLCDEVSLPNSHRELLPVISQLQKLSREHGETVLAGTLAFLRHNPIVDVVIVGALSRQQLGAIVAAWAEGSRAWSGEAIDVDAGLIDPRYWSRV